VYIGTEICTTETEDKVYAWGSLDQRGKICAVSAFHIDLVASRWQSKLLLRVLSEPDSVANKFVFLPIYSRPDVGTYYEPEVKIDWLN
jgi:hypothetical protein